MLNLALMRDRISSGVLPAIFETWVTEAFQLGAPGLISLKEVFHGHCAADSVCYAAGTVCVPLSWRQEPYFVSSSL